MKTKLQTKDIQYYIYIAITSTVHLQNEKTWGISMNDYSTLHVAKVCICFMMPRPLFQTPKNRPRARFPRCFLVSKRNATKGTHHELCQRDSPRCLHTALSRAADVMQSQRKPKLISETKNPPIMIHGTDIYSPTFWLGFYGKLVGASFQRSRNDDSDGGVSYVYKKFTYK